MVCVGSLVTSQLSKSMVCQVKGDELLKHNANGHMNPLWMEHMFTIQMMKHENH